jgi:hypothetical protein
LEQRRGDARIDEGCGLKHGENKNVNGRLQSEAEMKTLGREPITRTHPTWRLNEETASAQPERANASSRAAVESLAG